MKITIIYIINFIWPCVTSTRVTSATHAKWQFTASVARAFGIEKIQISQSVRIPAAPRSGITSPYPMVALPNATEPPELNLVPMMMYLHTKLMVMADSHNFLSNSKRKNAVSQQQLWYTTLSLKCEIQYRYCGVIPQLSGYIMGRCMAGCLHNLDMNKWNLKYRSMNRNIQDKFQAIQLF